MACSTANGARGDGGQVDGPTDAAHAVDGDEGDGGDSGQAGGGSNGLRCVGGFVPGLPSPPPPCGPDQICCVLPDETTACLSRAMGCPMLSGNPAGRQQCATAAECVMPGDICAFPDNPGLSAESCMPAPDDGGITGGSEASDGSDGAAEASIVDGATVNADGVSDATSSSDAATDAPVE